MVGKLQREIHQTKPFELLEEEAYLNLLRTADALSRQMEALVAAHGLTGTQYNALRILRGAGGDGATCSEVSERLLTRDPDVTRLLDRIEKLGFITRARSTKDRRVVRTQITRAGLDVLQQLDEPLQALLVKLFRPIHRERLAQLIADLEQLREQA